MAITIGNQASLGFYPQNVGTVSHTLGSGSNRMVIALFALHGATAYTITTSTYNGTNMTLIGSGQCPTLYARAIAIYAYYLPEASLPAAGSYNCAFKSNAGYAGGLMVIDLDNVVQSAPSYTANGNSNNPNLSGAYSNTITSTASTSLVLDGTSTEVNNSNTPTSPQTDIWGTVNMTGNTFSWGSRKFASGAGTQTMQWTPGGSYSHYEQLILSIDDIAGGGAVDQAAFFGMPF